MDLRPREEQKELSRTFRFKPTITAERIAESVAINRGTIIPKCVMVEKESMNSSIGMLRPHQMQNIEMNAGQTNQSSILSTRNSLMESQLRSSSASRGPKFKHHLKEKVSPARHASVPFNKSPYCKTSRDQPKTFFKASVGFLQASKNGALADHD